MTARRWRPSQMASRTFRAADKETSAVTLVEVGAAPRCRTGCETHARSRSSRRGICEVVELAVLDRPTSSCLVEIGLVPAFDVDDAQPADAERDSVISVGPGRSGPRWVITSVMTLSLRSLITGSDRPPSIWTTPQIPHIAAQRLVAPLRTVDGRRPRLRD